MASFDVWRKRIMSSLPGCPEDQAQLIWNEAAIDFCRRTAVWTATIEETIPAGVSVFDLIPDEGAVLAVQDVRFADGTVGSAAPASQPGQFRLARTFDQPASLSLTVVIVPNLDPTAEVPDWFVPTFYSALVDGTLMLAFKQTGRPWANRLLAAEHELSYFGTISTTAGMKARGFALQARQTFRRWL